MIPQQEKKYTVEEVNHLVAREVAKQRMGDLERDLSELKNENVKMWAKLDANFDSLQKAIECRDDDLRKEIERDFATKVEVAELRGEMGKLSIKVTAMVSFAVMLIEFISKIYLR